MPLRLEVPDEGRSDAQHEVGGHLLAVAGPAENQSQAAGVGDDGLRSSDAWSGVVVVGIEFMRTVVNDLDVVVREACDEEAGELEASVVGADVEAHVRGALGHRDTTAVRASRPARTSRTLSRASRHMRSRVRPPALAMWGCSTTFSRPESSGLTFGSPSKVSSAAPARWPLRSAEMRADSSTTPPRAALMR